MPLRTSPLLYAGRLARLFYSNRIEIDLPSDFLKAAAKASDASLTSVALLLDARSVKTEEDLNVILAGIGARAGRGKIDEAVTRYTRQLTKRVPILEQEGRIAGLSGPDAAERFAGRDLLDRLFSAAITALSSDLSRAVRLLDLTQHWHHSQLERKRQAAKRYAELLRKVKREDQLLAVTNAALAFFGTEQVDKERVRQAAYVAIAHVYRRKGPGDEALAILQRAMSELEWEGPTSRPAPKKVRTALQLH